MRQITDHVLMIRPANFGANPETANDNTFQSDSDKSDDLIRKRARQEFDRMVELLRSEGVVVKVIEDTKDPVKYDAVFPNNWISTHEDGAVITYPMWSPIRRNERRDDIIDELSGEYTVSTRYSFELFEEQELFLEGTGSMILDRQNKILYACLSNRTDIEMLDKFCVLRGFDKVVFHALSDDKPIYHTNVLMALGESFAVVCLDSIPDETEREALVESLRRTDKEVIPITVAQMNAFAGNMLELATTSDERLCVMSEQAWKSLDPEQIEVLARYCKPLPVPLYTIEESGGGSARCMIAEIFLPPL